MLDSIDRFNNEIFFTGEKAGIAVLVHLKEFKDWWQLRLKDNHAVFQNVLDLFTRPEDWPIQQHRQLRRMVRLEISSQGYHWISLVNQWLKNDRHWGDSNFLIHPPFSKREKTLRCDLYTSSGLSAATIREVAELLSSQHDTAMNLQKEGEQIIRSIGSYFVKLLEFSLKDDMRAVLMPEPLGEDRYSYVIVASTLNSALDKLDSIIGIIRSEQRKQELLGTHSFLSRLRSPENMNDTDDQKSLQYLRDCESAPVMLSIGQIIIYEGREQRKEVDCVVCFCMSPPRWHWSTKLGLLMACRGSKRR